MINIVVCIQRPYKKKEIVSSWYSFWQIVSAQRCLSSLHPSFFWIKNNLPFDLGKGVIWTVIFPLIGIQTKVLEDFWVYETVAKLQFTAISFIHIFFPSLLWLVLFFLNYVAFFTFLKNCPYAMDNFWKSLGSPSRALPLKTQVIQCTSPAVKYIKHILLTISFFFFF